MINDLKNWILLQCKRITPAEAVVGELMDAEMQLLKAETLREYADSQVSYNKNRVKRLKAYLAVTTTEETKETT
jgi:hypothetical protein